eukprot:scaffold1486_cov186-Alexandrium_tamarense.AAC.6
MQEANIAQTALARILKDDEENATNDSNNSSTGIANRRNLAPSSFASANITATATEGDKKDRISIAYPSAPHQWINSSINTCYSIVSYLEHKFGLDTPPSKIDVDEVPCYILPCLTCGRGERGRSNIKTIISLIFVPFFLLFFFLLDDIGRVMMRNMRLRNSHVKYIPPQLGGVKNLHFRRHVMRDWPSYSREVLLRYPELTVSIDGQELEARMNCPRGVLYLFHGCHRYAASFFYSPQGRQIVSMANDAGLIIVVFTKESELGCWDWDKDWETIRQIGKKFIKGRIQGSCFAPDGSHFYPPMYAFGASSGGAFIVNLAAKMKEDKESFGPFLFSAINVQIMAPPENLEWDIPTVFTVMNGDERTKQMVQQRVTAVEETMGNGLFKMIVTSGRKRVSLGHFAQVFEDDPQMTSVLSSDIYQDLTQLGVVGFASNQLVANPRFSNDVIASISQKYDVEARKEIAKSNNVDPEEVTPFGASKRLIGGLTPEEVNDAESIWLIEELNVAWDEHEITSEGFGSVLNFFVEHSGFQQQ